MPIAPLRPCAHPGCPSIGAGRFCQKHLEARQQRQADRQRIKSTLYGWAWRRESKRYLVENPWCVECLREHERVRADVTDHRKPHRGDPKLFWDRSNWQALCKRHHDRKTATDDSSFALGF